MGLPALPLLPKAMGHSPSLTPSPKMHMAVLQSRYGSAKCAERLQSLASDSAGTMVVALLVSSGLSCSHSVPGLSQPVWPLSKCGTSRCVADKLCGTQSHTPCKLLPYSALPQSLSTLSLQEPLL